MDTASILSAIDDEIARLATARAALVAISGQESGVPVRRGPGRPPKSVSAVVPKVTKRKMSAAGRARIAAAQKARWAAAKSASPDKVPAKSAVKKGPVKAKK